MPADTACDCGNAGRFRIGDRVWCYACHEMLRAALERLTDVVRAAVVARRLSPAAVQALADRLEAGKAFWPIASQATTPARRGVDFPCEECGQLAGSNLDNGCWRCASCGYPSK